MIIKKSADEVSEFAENIINTVREPLLLLDKKLRVVKASRSFFDFFKVSSDETIGTLIYNLGNNQWDIPKLRELLETILPDKTTFDNYEVEHDFSTIGKRIMPSNARQIERAFGKEKVILLAIEDITGRKREEKLLRDKNRLTGEYLDILFDLARTPIVIWDSSLIINRFNLEFQILSGYESSEVIGKPIKTLFPDDRADSFIDLLKNHLSDKNSEAFEIDILTKDKSIKTVLWNSTGIFDNEGKNIVATMAQDITDRKQTSEKLAYLETSYRILFESAQDGILTLNAETGKIIDANPFLCELLDYSKEKFIDKELWQIGFFKDIAANKEKFLELQKNGYVRYEDLPLETATGQIINVEFVSYLYSVNNHKVIQCNIRDNTIGKHNKDMLLKLSRAVEQSPASIIITDTEGDIEYINPKVTEITGYQFAEVIGKKPRIFSSGEKPKSEYKELWATITSGKEWRGEFHNKKKNGELYWESASISPIINEKGIITNYLAVKEDITEQKRAAEELLKAKEKAEESDKLKNGIPCSNVARN
ncbi:MAG: PAS domain S-box protein [Melioribacteraceae bacterium]|nr:PAS domain S-box protein [Melioribacteraceae bacterium]